MRSLLPPILVGSIFCLPAGHLSAQSEARSKILAAETDTIDVDTLSMIPGSIEILRRDGKPADTSCYTILPLSGRLVKKRHCPNDTLVIRYKTFPFLLGKVYQHKDRSRIQNNQVGQPYYYSAAKTGVTDFFKTEGLSRSGSISRGLSFGNKQDVVLNSSLNLQLAGKLSDQVDLILAATDQNIPIQPDGNTQQLQEFDKVFIQFGIRDLPGGGKTTVTAGDFVELKPRGYFMNYNKKLQGLQIRSELPGKQSGDGFRVMAAAAVSKGKFARNSSVESHSGNTFNGQKQERNQGPYKLRGAENEQYIIVLAGTEFVYLDGRLLERGQDRDYVIDYNTAEITFTPKNLITKDVRIAVEFQYSDKNYARSLFRAGTEFDRKTVRAGIHFYTEQDNKNRPLQQDLTDAEKLLLLSIGDTLQQAWSGAADSVGFNTTEVLYQKKDTLVGTGFFPDIFVYSTDSAFAHYRLSFTFVGAGKGNYRLSPTGANGKVYEWVLPDTVTGSPRGSYEPIRLLITPKLRQMVTAGAEIRLSKYSGLSVEGAMSRYDVNTFSPYEKANDEGFAGKLNWDLRMPLLRRDSSSAGKMPGAWYLLSGIQYEYLQLGFSPIERFRPVEFERDWNRSTTLQQSDQHIGGARIGFAGKENLILYDFRAIREGSFYEGNRHGGKLHLGKNGFLLTADGSFLESESSARRSGFLRNQSSLSKSLRIRHSVFKLGVRQRSEEILNRALLVDSLLPGSLRNLEWEPFAEWADSSGNKYSVYYRQRTDEAPYSAITGGRPELTRSTLSENYGASADLIRNPRSQLRVNASFRRLNILNPAISGLKPENTIIGRAEYTAEIWKGLIASGTYYEVGSGLEVKKDFIYLEVAPGQGTHIWTDYNENGIKEIDEFEISPFPQEANFLKLWVPTDDYISAYTNQFSEVLTLNPSSRWRGKKGIRKFLTHFSNQTAYRTDRKTTNSDLALAYNPFLGDTQDSTLVTLNSSLRNTFSVLPGDPVFGIDLSFQDMRNKTLLENDTSTRRNVFQETRLRWNLNRRWSVHALYKQGEKRNDSRFFISKNYALDYFEAEPRVQFISGSSLRVSVSYKYASKKNSVAGTSGIFAAAQSQNAGMEIRYSAPGKGVLLLKSNYIHASYNDAENTSLAYEMLDGLKEGDNYTWSVGYSRNLSGSIQLTLQYDGRRSPGVTPIHTGNAQVRANF